MLPLKGKSLRKSPLSLLKRIHDLQSFEGPMMVLYQHEQSKQLFLCDWVDRSEQANRWLLYRTTAKGAYQFVQGAIPQLDLFRDKFSKGEFWTFDVSAERLHSNFLKISPKELPPAYFPQAYAFFDKADCPAFEELERFLSQQMFRELALETARKFSDAYQLTQTAKKQQEEPPFHGFQISADASGFRVQLQNQVLPAQEEFLFSY